MYFSSFWPLAFVGWVAAQRSNSSSCQCIESSYPALFSSGFQQPNPPIVMTEFTAAWNQHKWNSNVSHIAAGFLYNSPSNAKVRADLSYDVTIGTSVFDFKNTSHGLVSNTLITYSPSLASKPTVFQDYVNSDFPLFTGDVLQTNQAVFTGLEEREYNGKAAGWSILYQGAIPVTVFTNCCNFVVGYDYFSPGLRTRVVTEFFNIQQEKIPSDVFKLPK